MKRNICIWLPIILCITIFLPITTYAETYNLGDTDMSISVDDTVWYVFTRENIKNSSELKELNLTYDTMYDILYNNEAYMDAILLHTDGEYVELFIRKRALDTGVINLSNYKDAEVLDFAKQLAKNQGVETYSVHKSQYSFVKLEYIASNYYLCEYITIMNGDSYALTFQSTSQFTDVEYAEIENIVDSVKFDVDTSIKEKKSTSIAESVVEKTIGGAVLAAIFVGTPKLYRLGKKKKAESIQNGKIYYGLLWCRVFALLLAGIISSDIILMVLFGDSVEGTVALLLMLLCSLPFTALYVYIYKRSFEKKYLSASSAIIGESSSA